MEGLRLGWSATFFWKTEKQVSVQKEETPPGSTQQLPFHSCLDAQMVPEGYFGEDEVAIKL